MSLRIAYCSAGWGQGTRTLPAWRRRTSPWMLLLRLGYGETVRSFSYGNAFLYWCTDLYSAQNYCKNAWDVTCVRPFPTVIQVERGSTLALKHFTLDVCHGGQRSGLHPSPLLTPSSCASAAEGFCCV